MCVCVSSGGKAANSHTLSTPQRLVAGASSFDLDSHHAARAAIDVVFLHPPSAASRIGAVSDTLRARRALDADARARARALVQKLPPRRAVGARCACWMWRRRQGGGGVSRERRPRRRRPGLGGGCRLHHRSAGASPPRRLWLAACRPPPHSPACRPRHRCG